jgi:predicted Zn-dependent peptidase
LIVAAAGSLDARQFMDLVSEKFSSLRRGANGLDHSAPHVVSRIIMRNKKALEQVQICVGVPSHPISHEMRYASYVLNTLLGGGMSSRLFQNIRERQGLAYAIYSDLNPFRDTGCLSVYAGTSREAAPKVIDSVVEEFRRLKNEPIPADELQRAKDQLKGNLMLSLESSSARMSNLARQEMYFDRFFGLDEIIEKIQAVSGEELQKLAADYFQGEKIAVTCLGNLNGLRLRRDELVC